MRRDPCITGSKIRVIIPACDSRTHRLDAIMAFSGFASAANIGSFVLQAVSFGQCTMNKHNKIESRLSKAIDHLKVAMDQLRKYSEYLDDEEFNESMNKCQR